MIKLKQIVGLPSLHYHLENDLSLYENVYRYSSDRFIQLFSEARDAWRDGLIELSEEDSTLLETTDIGKYGNYEGGKVALDLPMLDEAEYQGKDVPLNKPKRGGSKKFYVYTKNKKDNVVKVSFGGTTGLNVKIDEPGARSSFAARHKCATKKDKTKPGYWSCNIGRYWKSLGGKRNFSGYW
jgi:hypothetical protein|tara:strand:+ start:2210 stop:2755 length:546 start_codon:yes stop_codon:yes gene_type:complete